MTPKEQLSKLTTKQIAIDLFNIVSNGKYNMNNLVHYFNRIDETLTELEELKRDVKRYFDLGHIEEPSTEQFEEYLKLTDKLLEVGVKDV